MQSIDDKPALVAALRDASNLEHQLMVQYLYAGFSLKRDPGPGCTPAQYEVVRRWSSTLFMVARQEMEHLSLASSMLTAIGAPVHFARTNIGKKGLQSPYFHSATLERTTDADGPPPVSLPYKFERFDRRTIERFICGESPPYKDLPEGVDPEWCFACVTQSPPDGEQPPLAIAQEEDIPPEPSYLAAAAPLAEAPAADGAPRPGFQAGSVQELYLAIRKAFESIDGIFAKRPPQIEIPVEYNVFAYAVTDRTTAVAAVNLILEQGEGLGDPWNLDAHFRRFWDIRKEFLALKAADKKFDPAYPLLRNPTRDSVTDPLAGKVFDACNEAYVMMLLILTSLYQHAVPAAKDKYPFLSSSLSQNAFAPVMTMIVRALNEVLVLLPIDEGRKQRTGSNYFIPHEDRKLLLNPRNKSFADITFLLGRWERMTAAILDAATDAERLAEEKIGTEAERVEATTIARALRYIHHSARRTGSNLRQTYQSGLYSKFVSVNS